MGTCLFGCGWGLGWPGKEEMLVIGWRNKTFFLHLFSRHIWCIIDAQGILNDPVPVTVGKGIKMTQMWLLPSRRWSDTSKSV